MAIRQKPSGVWEVYYRNPLTGKRQAESCMTQKEAVQRDALIKYRIKFERESFELREEQVPKEAMTFEDVLWLFLKSKNYTKEQLKSQMKIFGEIATLYKEKLITEISSEEVERLMTIMQGRGCRGTTIARKLKGLKAMLRWAVMEKYIPELPQIPSITNAITEHFVPPTKREVLQMMKVASPHIQRMIVIGYCFGARVGPCELFKLAWSDVDLDRKLIRMPSSKKNRLEPWRELPIREELIPMFQLWKEQDDAYPIPPRTVIHYQGRQVSSLKRAWKATLEKAGITRRIRPYDLRHAFATEAIAAGVDIGTTARMMGHQNPLMLLKYYQHVLDEQKMKAMRAIPCVSDLVSLDEIGS